MLHHAGHIPSLFPNPLDLHVLAISQHKDTLGEKKNPESSVICGIKWPHQSLRCDSIDLNLCLVEEVKNVYAPPSA